MKEVRCPECGYRLKTNECPICLKRVPFPLTLKQSGGRVQQKGKIKVSFPKTAPARKKRRTGDPKWKIVSAVVALVLAFAPLIGELMDWVMQPEPDYPEYSYLEDYVEAGAAGATDVPAMEMQTIYDDQGIRITADSFGLLYGEPAVAVTVSNTSEKNVTVSLGAMAVNGYMMPGSGLYCQAQAGETVQSMLWMDGENLRDAGIDTVADMVLQLAIYDSDDYGDIASDVVIRLKTAAAGLVQPVDDSGRKVYEADGIRLVFRSAQVDDYGDAKIQFFAENLTNDPVYIGADSILINGEETDGMFWCQLWPDTRCVDRVYLYEMEEYGVRQTADLKQLRLEFYVENSTNWQRVSETIVIDMDR